MKTSVKKAILKLNSIDWDHQFLGVPPCDGMVVYEWHNDLGPSSELTIRRGNDIVPPVNLQHKVEDGVPYLGKTRNYWLNHYDVKPDDTLRIKTASSLLTATVELVLAVAGEIKLINVQYDGCWANFGFQCSFGNIEMYWRGDEEVIATGFSGTLRQYYEMRRNEDGYTSIEAAQKTRGQICLLHPDAEKAERLAEAAGY